MDDEDDKQWPCVANLSVGAGRYGRSVKIAGAHEDCTTPGHYYTCHKCDSAYLKLK